MHSTSIRWGWCVLIVVGLLPRLVWAQQPAAPDTITQTLTLPALLAEVRASNLALEAARLEAGALATRSRQVSALPDPSLGVTYQPRPILTARGYQRSQWRLQQQVPFPGKLRLRGEIADLGAKASSLKADVLAHELMLRAKRMFFKLYRIQEQTQLIQAFQERLEGFEEVAATRYEVGSGAQQAVLKAQLEKNRLAQRLLNLSETRRTAALALAELLNRPNAEALTAGQVHLERPDVQIAAAEAKAVALARRAEADVLQTQIEQAGAQVDLAQKQFWPDFTLSASYFDIGAGGPMPSMTGRDALALNVGIEIPLWRGKLQANLEEARLRRRKAQARYEDLQVQIKTQVSDLINQIRTERRTLTLYEETLIPQAEVALESSLSAYTTGQTDFLNLLDSERTLFSLQMSYEEAVKRYLDATAALERALGTTLPEVDAP